MAQLGAAKSVAVNMLGKVKTACQMIAIPLLLFWDPLGTFPTQAAGSLLIRVAAVLTLVSMFYYLKLAMPRLRAAGEDLHRTEHDGVSRTARTGKPEQSPEWE